MRFAAFGVASIAGLVALRFNPLRRLGRADWLRVCVLGLLGNVLFDLVAAQAIQMSGPTPVAPVIGTLPVAIAVVANVRRRAVAWGRLPPPLAAILAGVVIVTLGAADTHATSGGAAAAAGVGLAVVGLVSWLAYALLNAEWLNARTGMGPLVWTCLTGLGTLIVPVPTVAVGLAPRPDALAPAAGASIGELLMWGAVIGLGSTYAATWLWNGASSRLPATLLGYLIVSETLFAMLYACVFSLRAPSVAELVSATFIIGGVVWGLTAARAGGRAPTDAPASAPSG